MNRIYVEPAKAEDYESIVNLLNHYRLITQDIDFNEQLFFVLKQNGNCSAFGAIEFYQPYGLIRSLAVNPDKTKLGYASKILVELEKCALTNEITELYLLTETAESFFAGAGFKKIDRVLAPEIIQQTNQFSGLCPASAAVMTKSIIPLV